MTLDWVKSDRLVHEFDFDPKVLLKAPEGEPGWRNLDLTPNVEYSPAGWLDLVSVHFLSSGDLGSPTAPANGAGAS